MEVPLYRVERSAKKVSGCRDVKSFPQGSVLQLERPPQHSRPIEFAPAQPAA